MSDEQCDAEAAGYDGMFGVYCDRPKGHDGLHCDGMIEWRDVARDEHHECGRENDA